MEHVVSAEDFLTYSQSIGASSSLVSRLARLTLVEVNGGLSTGYDIFNVLSPGCLFFSLNLH